MIKGNVLFDRPDPHDYYKDHDDLIYRGEETPLEMSDCSNSVIPPTVSPGKSEKKKVVVSDPVSMTKFLFDRYRLPMYTYLNTWRRNGKLSRLIGYKVINRVLNKQAVEFTHVNYWRIDRENFLADIEVELTLDTTEGSLIWTGFIVAWCSFDDTFHLSFEDLTRTVDRNDYDVMSQFLVPIYTNRMIDDRAESLWYRYLPEALHDSKARDAAELAKRMGLEVRFYNIYDNRGIKERQLLASVQFVKNSVIF